jgi:hypothetical protein
VLYLDDYRREGWSHLVAHNEATLRRVAGELGLPDRWLREAGTPRVHYLVPERARGRLVDAGAVEIGARELGELVASRCAAAAAFPAPAAAAEPVYVDVPTPVGDPPAPRQRWNPTLGRHAWARLAEHWYLCLYCGVIKWKREGSGARWYMQWGYREWPADEWGSTRAGADFPRCPGPGQRVTRERLTP